MLRVFKVIVILFFVANGNQDHTKLDHSSFTDQRNQTFENTTYNEIQKVASRLLNRHHRDEETNDNYKHHKEQKEEQHGFNDKKINKHQEQDAEHGIERHNRHGVHGRHHFEFLFPIAGAKGNLALK